MDHILGLAIAAVFAPQDEPTKEERDRTFEAAFKVAVNIAENRCSNDAARARAQDLPYAPSLYDAGFDSFEFEAQALEPLVTKAALAFLESRAKGGKWIESRIALLTIAKRRNGIEAEHSLRQLLLSDRGLRRRVVLQPGAQTLQPGLP